VIHLLGLLPIHEYSTATRGVRGTWRARAAATSRPLEASALAVGREQDTASSQDASCDTYRLCSRSVEGRAGLSTRSRASRGAALSAAGRRVLAVALSYLSKSRAFSLYRIKNLR
jgi:hypothetical protein